jgi:hypothetical protein
MRAAEFMRAVADVIDALDGDSNTSNTLEPEDNPDLQDNPVMMTPQQQELELAKHKSGKMTPAIAKLIANDDTGEEGINDNPLYIGSATPSRDMAVKSDAPLTLSGKCRPGV